MHRVVNEMWSGAEAAGTALSSPTASSPSSAASSKPATDKSILKQRMGDETNAKKCLDKEFGAADMAVDPHQFIMPYGLNTAGYGDGATATDMTGRPSGSMQLQSLGEPGTAMADGDASGRVCSP